MVARQFPDGHFLKDFSPTDSFPMDSFPTDSSPNDISPNVVKLNNQSKQEHFNSLNPFLDSKSFLKSFKSYFSNKHSFGDSKSSLNEIGEILTKSIKIGKTLIRTLNQLQILLNYSTGPFSQISSITTCKILLKVIPFILVLLKSSTKSG